MVIYICCAGSGTSLVYANWIKEQLNNDDKVLVDFMSNVTAKYNSGELAKYELVLAHGSGFVSIPKYFEDQKFKDIVNLVYMMPQVAFNLPKFKEALEPHGIHCLAFSPKELTDATLHHEKVLDYLREHILKYNLKCKIKF